MGYYIMTGVVSLYQRVNVSLTYQLPSYPSADNWTIRTEATQQVHDHQFMVEHYYIRLHPIFQVMPSTPAYVLDSNETWYTVEVTTSVHSGFVANGNVTVHAYTQTFPMGMYSYKVSKYNIDIRISCIRIFLI